MANDVEHGLLKFYRKLWSAIGGRPWTYIMRDIWHQLEYLPACILVLAGALLNQFFDWKQMLLGWAIFTVGYIWGHLFWGTDWKAGEEGDDPDA